MSTIKLLRYSGDIRKQKLLIPVKNKNDLLTLFSQFSKVKKINTLVNTIERFEQIFKINFYNTLLTFILKWATEYDIDSLDAMEQGSISNKVFTAKEARYWLANAFIMNTDRCHKPKYGELNFVELYNGSIVGQEKLLCILNYFYMATKLDEDRPIGFFRCSVLENPKKLFNSDKKVNTDLVIIHTNDMESVKADAIVNFANEQLSYGLINSCTQEEILNVCTPESYISLLFCEAMRDNEVIVVRGCRRFSTYSGYLNSFKFTGQYNDTLFQDQIGLDACTWAHFSEENVNRDIMKAYTGFEMVTSDAQLTIISTGMWGCGAFGGDPIHKFLQQLLVVSVIPYLELYYSTYKNTEMANKLNNVVNYINKNNITIKELYEELADGGKFGIK